MMTASAFNSASQNTTIARRPAFDVLVERVAKSLLAWSDRRALKTQVLNSQVRNGQVLTRQVLTDRLTHERMTLMLENQRSLSRGGSALFR